MILGVSKIVIKAMIWHTFSFSFEKICPSHFFLRNLLNNNQRKILL